MLLDDPKDNISSGIFGNPGKRIQNMNFRYFVTFDISSAWCEKVAIVS